MLKFLDKDNKVRYILTDDGVEPQEVSEIAASILRELGIKVIEEDIEKLKKPTGVSQDDLKCLEGE